MSSLVETLKLAHRVLADAGVDHALIGGLAMGGLGVHRATADVDFLVDGAKRDIAKTILENAGFNLLAETSEVMHFGGFGHLDILFANRPPSRKMLDRAFDLRSIQIRCVQAEDIIGLKIQAYINEPGRALQDKADIAAIIKANPELDWEIIKGYADLFDQWPEIERLRTP